MRRSGSIVQRLRRKRRSAKVIRTTEERSCHPAAFLEYGVQMGRISPMCRRVPKGAHNRTVSMYVEVLSGAIDRWVTELSGDDLIDYVLSCRAALPAQDLGAGVWSEVTLVAEVAYDRALINLAAEFGIDVTPTNFAHPRIERFRRLEVALKRGHGSSIPGHSAGINGSLAVMIRENPDPSFSSRKWLLRSCWSP